jgi:hypothetical protein
MSNVSEQTLSAINTGREAALVLNGARGIIEEMTTQILENAVSAHRGGLLDAQAALVAWAKVDAIWAVQETLEARIQTGEAAAATLHRAHPRD